MGSADEFSIFRAAEEDRDSARRIVFEYLETIREHVALDDVASEVSRHFGGDSAAMFLARTAELVAGCVMVHPLEALPDAFEIKRLYVAPRARGAGLAARLMASAEAHAKACGARRIVLDTKETMHEARRLYERLGYAEIPRYHDRPDIHLFMGKDV